MVTFTYDSARAKKARLAHHFATNSVRAVMIIGALGMIAGGALLLLYLRSPFGWFVAGLSGPFLMLAAWSKELRKLPVDPKGTTIETLLDADLLGMLPKDPTPKQLAELSLHLAGGKFMVARFGLGANFLPPLVGQQAADTAQIWQEAERLRVQLGHTTISAATVTAALIRSLPNVNQILAEFRIDSDDITAGVAWYQHITTLAQQYSTRRVGGGIGRDWSFGYTPMLEQFGTPMHLQGAPMVQSMGSRQGIILQMLHLLAQGGRHNVALVGALGSGKTTLVRSLAEYLTLDGASVPPSLHYNQVIALDPSSLIARAKGRGDLEGIVQHLCYEALSAKNTILFLDDAQLFFEDSNGAVNLSNVLMPILEGGALRIILAMDEQRWLRISQANPALAQQINRIAVPPATEADTMTIMEEEVPIYEHQNGVLYTYQALKTAYRLSDRFLSEQVMPGRALKLLESAANSSENKLVSDHSVEQAIEQTQGIKVSSANTAAERETLLNLEALIHERMINQTRAVTVVSDALRRARAGVRNQQRPIGTFLFLGPTGVGKTELAKSVAAVFFGGEDNLVRIDLNEFSGPNDVARLIADPAQDSHSLTAQISRNPFSVVLLDEIEKAHPNVLNTLLQMLDEGILRDISNRQVSFRDAVVIATSNAGADRIREHIEKGEQLEQFEGQFTNELIGANTFRPEFLNRFDEIVLFRPLTQDELMQVIDIIMKGVNKNLAAQKVTVAIDDDAKRMLVQAGYDPRLGARPMRRVVQRVVENFVANQMLSGQATAGAQIRISAQDVQTMLQQR